LKHEAAHKAVGARGVALDAVKNNQARFRGSGQNVGKWTGDIDAALEGEFGIVVAHCLGEPHAAT
jgi:hypothetical protein